MSSGHCSKADSFSIREEIIVPVPVYLKEGQVEGHREQVGGSYVK